MLIQGGLIQVRPFGDPCSARVPRSSVFEGSFAGNVFLETGIAEVRSRLHAARCVLFDFFWRYVHVSWQAQELRHFWWRVRTSFCVAGAGHRTLFHPRDRRRT